MSRIGKAGAIPAASPRHRRWHFSVKGQGHPHHAMRDEISYIVEDGISVQPANDTRRAAFWGMQRTLVQNLVDGWTKGFPRC
jgi:large subunit ribosomal protein L6